MVKVVLPLAKKCIPHLEQPNRPQRHVISTEGGAFAAVAERPLYFSVPGRRYFFFPFAVFTETVLTETTFTGTTIGRRIGTSPDPGSCCYCIRDSISVRT